MSGRDDRAADWLTDREPIVCDGCGGDLYVIIGDTEWPCLECGGTGIWRGQP